MAYDDWNNPFSPIARLDTYTIRAGGTLTVGASEGLLANDTDPRGLTLAAHWSRTPSDTFPFLLEAAADGSFTLQSLPTSLSVVHSSYAAVSSSATARVMFGHGQVTIKILNDAPVVQDETYTVHGNRMLVVPAEAGLLANDSDPEGHDLQFLRVFDGTGQLMTSSEGGLSFAARGGAGSTQSYTYTVLDAYGGRAEGRVSFESRNELPLAGSDTVWVHPGRTVTLMPDALLANDSDADVDALRITAWSLTDLEGKAKAQPGTDGSLMLGPDGRYSGELKIRYTVADGVGGSAVGTVTVHVGNEAPWAADDVYALTLNQRLSVRQAGVLANDRDAEGDRLRTPSVDTQGLRGQLALGGDGSFDFTPEPGFVGRTSARVLVEDDFGGRSWSTLSFEVRAEAVVNQAPRALDDSVRMAEGTTTRIAVLANDQDPDPGQTLKIVSVDTPRLGQAMVLADGTIRYTPPVGWNGEMRIGYTVADGFGGTARAVAVVDVVGSHAGTPGDDVINGWSDDDSLDGRAGDDWLLGLGGADFIRAGTGDDHARGGEGADVLLGEDGDDTLQGDAGADVLMGGRGADTIYTAGLHGLPDADADRVVFDTVPTGQGGGDTVIGFSSAGSDRLVFDPAVFTALRGGPTTGVDAEEFVAGPAARPRDTNDVLLYDTETQTLWYDADGSGPGAAVSVAHFVQLVGTIGLNAFSSELPAGV